MAGAEYGLLTSVPGIGQVLATTILLEMGRIKRFAAAGNFAFYARCVDSVRTSIGKKKREGNTKNGNKYLPWAFVETAHFALRYCAEVRENWTIGTIGDRQLDNWGQLGTDHDFETAKPWSVPNSAPITYLRLRGESHLVIGSQHARAELAARTQHVRESAFDILPLQ